MRLWHHGSRHTLGRLHTDKVNHIGSLTAFLVFGIGTEMLAVIALFVMFRRRGWMGKKS